jgi:hypothetical protein
MTVPPAPASDGPPPPGGDRRPRRDIRPAVVAAAAIVVLVVGAGVAYAVKSLSDRQTPDDSANRPSASTTSNGPATFPASVAGDWEGSLSQSDGQRHAVRMTLRADTTDGTVTYPDLPCEGTLELTRIAGPTFTVREKITRGNCTPAGTFTLTVTSPGLSFRYEPDSRRYTADGRLDRR